ncbi:MAG: DNA mismatch repair endonuclease MutL [Ignavibacteria bacterium]|nr:DNA mismatch repair endonuclease MutL [Ignavibacteria bacterium]
MTDHTIHILPDHLANQIAAGEVVQRPESAVKELVENAVDAGATSVTVIVREAGKQLIHVIDNGSGMSKSDLELSVIRHATSKISTEEDLHAIRTLGFRGEAMASIAAVSDVEIRTRRSDDETGWTLLSRPGQTPDLRASATDVGTQVLVRSLFYNVPARRKFLKADLTEFRHVSETMQRMALARPDVRFIFYDNQSLVFDVRPGDLRRRISDILSLDASRALVPVDMSEGGFTITGFVGLPHVARQSRSGQFLFLNNRPIVSRSLAHAVASAYEHLLDAGQHPVFVLHVSVDPHRVDVNVHPQKQEVKFEDERQAYLLVQQAVTKVLSQANVIPSFLGDVPLASRPLQSLPTQADGSSMVINRYTGEILSRSSERSASPFPSTREPVFTPAMQQAYGQLFAKREEQETGGVLQAGGQFIVTTSAEGLVVVDQRSAHERVIYERVLKRTEQESSGQSLLFAVTVRLGPTRGALLREYAAEFEALGFRLDVEKDGTVQVHAVPSDVRPGSEDSVLDEILQALEQSGTLPKERRKEGIASVYAARQAIRRGDKLNTTETAALVRDLFACAVPHVTPRGEATYIIITFEELAQRCT